MRQVDDRMIDVFHIELLQMMENASRNLADFAESLLATELTVRAPATITILFGSGGNGGGGLVEARHLLNRGHAVNIISATPLVGFASTTKKLANILLSMGASITVSTTIPENNIIIDCLIGYSLVGKPCEPFATLIRTTNNSMVPIIALDTPSGLDVTSGEALTLALRPRPR